MTITRYKDSTDPVRTDGRDIDPELGALMGEGAAQQIKRPVDEHLAEQSHVWEVLPEPNRNDPTYYERPVLKQPVWEWAIPLYYYVGGAAGASLVLGAALQLDGGHDLDSLIRRCHWTGIIGSSVGGAVLIHDLGRPMRFLHMMRVFRPTSPMNMGTWILASAAPTAFTAGFFLRRPGIWGTIGEVFGYISGIFGMGLATYTGVLVGNTVVPVWSESKSILPILFGFSAMASAGSIFDMSVEHKRGRKITRTFGMIGRIGELTAAYSMERKLLAEPRIAKPLKTGRTGFLWKAATALTAGSLVTMLLPNQTKKKRIAAGVMGTLGSLTLRYAVHQAGCGSTMDPRATFHPQRARMQPEEKADQKSVQPKQLTEKDPVISHEITKKDLIAAD